jgi:hypothetical protein
MKKLLIIISILFLTPVAYADLGTGLIGYWPLDYRDTPWQLTGGDLVTNGSFTTDTTGWTDTVNGTIASVAGGVSGNALQVTNDIEVPTANYAEQTITTVANTNYYLTFYHKDGNSAGNVTVTDAQGTQCSTGSISDANWTQYTCSFFTIASSVTIRLKNNDGINNTTLFDTVTLTKLVGTTVDRSGNGNTGTLTNMNQGTTPLAGKLGQALSFDGVNDKVSTANLSFASGQMSVSVWIKPNNLSSTSKIGIISQCGSGSTNKSFELKLRGEASKSYFTVYDTSGVAHAQTEGTSGLTVGSWVHMVGTYDGTNLHLYENAVLKDQSAITSSNIQTALTAKTEMGVSDCNVAPIDGLMDDVRVYNRVLSAGEVRQLYNLGTGNHLGSFWSSILSILGI